jgi:catechol 2,3-dioxygenase-like lactoylglutathione lyase family enzyme
MRIGVIEVFVDDQERARKFYADVLGFQVKVDMSYSDTDRWLTVVSPEVPDGPELLLAPVTAAAAALQAARRETGTPALSFTTADCFASHHELVGKGAVFLSEPHEKEYGGTDAVFEDGCGNLLNLHQD